MSKLEGKVAVITGGNSGMGLATARLFVEEGASVVITGRRQKELDEAVASVDSKRLLGFAGDIASMADTKRLHDFVKDRFGKVDVIFAHAGAGTFGPFGTVSEDDFDKVVNVNLKGTFFTVQALLPLVPDGGSISANEIAGPPVRR